MTKIDFILVVIVILLAAFLSLSIGFIIGDNKPTTTEHNKTSFYCDNARIYIDSRGRFILTTENAKELNVEKKWENAQEEK